MKYSCVILLFYNYYKCPLYLAHDLTARRNCHCAIKLLFHYKTVKKCIWLPIFIAPGKIGYFSGFVTDSSTNCRSGSIEVICYQVTTACCFIHFLHLLIILFCFPFSKCWNPNSTTTVVGFDIKMMTVQTTTQHHHPTHRNSTEPPQKLLGEHLLTTAKHNKNSNNNHNYNIDNNNNKQAWAELSQAQIS